MFSRLRQAVKAFNVPSSEAMEADYLNGAVDRFDLEYRQREIDRGLFRKRNFGSF